MRLKKTPYNILLVITFLIITFIGCINDINNLNGYIIYGLLIVILLLNTTILIKYGRND